MTEPARLSSTPRPGRPPCDPLDAARAVVVAQMLFTAGDVLTTGGFLYYFANALNPSASMFAALLVAPELFATCAVFSRSVIQRLGSRKRTWIVCYVLARIAALGIPAMASPAFRPSEAIAFWVLVGALGISHAFQSIAYTAFISWLSDLVPRQNWGEFFALRRIANVSLLVLLPAIAALLRKSWSDWTSDETVRRAYLAVFLTGNLLLWLAIPPILRLPDVPGGAGRHMSRGWRRHFLTVWANRPLRLMFASSLWLAAAQGLTQSAFFRYQTNVLHLPLEAYLLLASLMNLLQIPGSIFGGWLSDREHDKRGLVAGLIAVSCAMAFWLLARPESPYWLVGAYAVWGLFGTVNICQRNLLLKTAPPSDNTLPISILRQFAGFVAGMAGLAGGLALDHLEGVYGSSTPLRPFVILFAASWVGRATAAMWLARVPQPVNHTANSGV